MEIGEFFDGQPEARRLFEFVRSAVECTGPSELRVTKSQIAFKRKRGFAWVWMPGQYLRRSTPPLVLSLSLRRRDASPRWKEIVEPYPGRFMHHMELSSAGDIDEWLRALIAEAWKAAA